MESPRNANLPEDVIFEILVRLPVETLLRFKCVCKQWYLLIGSATFISQHYVGKNNQESLLVRHYKPDEERYTFALYRDELLSEYEEPDNLQVPAAVASLMGPLNGVFCVISISGRMALLNPATRQFRPLPPVPPNAHPHLAAYDDLLGFGMDPSTGDYKIVSIQYFWNEESDTPHFPSLISVFSSGSDSWRHFEDMELVNSSRCAYRSLCNTYVNGVYYWLTEFNESDVAVLAFDMSSEKFQEIQVSDCNISKEADLALYDDSIALLSCDLEQVDKCVDVWVLGNNGCWTRILKLGPLEDIKWPLGFWKNNELLLETGIRLLTLFDISSQSLRTIDAWRKENGFFIYWVFTYKESLVSIKGPGNRCKLWDTSLESIQNFFII